MNPQLLKGGTWQSASSAQAYVNGAWRSLLYGMCYASGAWQQIFNFTPRTPRPPRTPTPTPTAQLTLSVNATEISTASQASGSSVTNVTTSAVTATPSGGAAPYTYQWVLVSSDGHSFTINGATSASATVSTRLAVGEFASCTIRCTARDSTGLSATSPIVSASLDR